MVDGWIGAVTGFYLTANAARLCAYVPQARQVAICKVGPSLVLSTWLVPSFAYASTAAYALTIQHNALLALWSIVNFGAGLLVAALAMRARRAAKGASFYSAAYVGATRSGEHGLRRRGRVDAAFLDAVTRDQRHAVQLQFRPFDVAAGIGIRAARMKRAA